MEIWVDRSKTLPPIHPGEILLEEFLKPLDMNPHQLAMALRVPPNPSRRSSRASARSPQKPHCALAAISVSIRSFGTYDLRAAAREHQAQIERDVQPRAE